MDKVRAMKDPKRIKQRFEYIDNMGFQEIWRHTFDADLGEGPSITAGLASTMRIAVVPFGTAREICETLSAATDGLEVPSSAWDRG